MPFLNHWEICNVSEFCFKILLKAEKLYFRESVAEFRYLLTMQLVLRIQLKDLKKNKMLRPYPRILIINAKLFLTLSNKIKKVFMHSLCTFVHALTLVNILHKSSNLYMLFIPCIAWTALKSLYIRLTLPLQWRTKIFRHISADEDEMF